MSESKSVLTREEWLLLALSASGGGSLTPAQLQKLVFIMQDKLEEVVQTSAYPFIPFNYGPFSKEIYQDAEKLAGEGKVRISYSSTGFRTYGATKNGRETVSDLYPKLGENAAAINGYLVALSKWVSSLSFTELVSKVYDLYPDYRINSIFKEVK